MQNKIKKGGNVPNLRFPGFEGEWENKTLDELGDFTGGGTPKSSNIDFWNGSIPWVSSSDLDEKNIFSIRVTRFITQEAIDSSATKLCIAPVILIVSRVGVGKVAYSEKDICTSQDFTNMTNFKCNGVFLSYLLSITMREASGSLQGTSIKGISSGEIKSKIILIPKKEEQIRIVNLISLIDERIQTQNKIIKELESLKISLLNKLLFKEIRFKDENGNNFPDWGFKKIKDVLTIGSGKDYKHLNTGSVPVFGTGGLMTYVDSHLYDGETVCIGRKGTIDKPQFHNGKIWTVDTLFYTHSFRDIIPKFIFYIFLTINWKEHNEASGVPSLSKNNIEKIEINIPIISEQTKIANFLSTLDNKIDTELRLMEMIQNQKKYLLQNLFI